MIRNDHEQKEGKNNKRADFGSTKSTKCLCTFPRKAICNIYHIYHTYVTYITHIVITRKYVDALSDLRQQHKNFTKEFFQK